MKFINNLIFITLLAIVSLAINAKQFYRFKNEEGNLVVKDQVSKEMIEKGYDVISDTGNLIRRVAPGKTLAEIEQDKLKKIEERKEKLAFKRKIKSDAELLRQFSSITDIIRNRDAQLLAIEQRIKIQGSKSDLLRLQLEDQQRQAATHERLGQKIPKLLQQDIIETRRQIENNDNSSVTLEEEKVDVAARYQRDIIRYKELESLRMTLKKDKPSNDGSSAVLYDCNNRDECDRAWQLAQIYAKDNASGQIEIITNALIVTSTPLEDNDISLSFSKIPTPNNKDQIVFEITCKDSEVGAEFCKSEVVKNIRMNYLKLVKQRVEN
ncbi:hypothetical protein ACUR5C_02025 [Aliikangiella sp. IMCC44653]